MRSDWLGPLRSVLDGWDTVVDVFFRDDDAGWEDERLHALLERFSHRQMPIDLAVIPRALSPGLAETLLERRRRDPLGLHQHGYAHVNHEAAGRKCEFGLGRAAADQGRDLRAGRERLSELLGPALDSIFTPPWNRCTEVTGECLAAVGVKALSRDRTAPSLGRTDLQEIPVQVDWCGLRARSEAPWSDLGSALAERFAEPNGQALGLMLHHAVMDGDDLDRLDELLVLLRDHDKAFPRLMGDLLN
jgi:hypothetical protein